MKRLEFAIDQIRSVRGYTNNLLASIDTADWFRMPVPGVTHIGWEVGHLAMAEYRLCLQRTRGVRPEDEDLIGSEILERYKRGSVPHPAPSANPSVETLRAALDRVHEQTLAELPSLTEKELDEAADPSHPMFHTKFEALLWCVRHEAIHTGHIALLRRQLGAPPLR